MGIADYGANQTGFYQYSTNDSLGAATIVSLQTLNSTGDRRMSIQLNVVLAFIDNNVPFVYWIQDVAQINTATNRISFLDNVWNFSAISASINPVGISGNGHVATANGIGYYYDFAASSLPGDDVVLSYPATVTFLVSTGTNSLRQPVVRFQYEDGFGFKTYDTVTFKVDALTSFSGFVVNGNDYTPRGLFYDSELVLGGAGEGWQTALVQSDVRLKLYYYNGHNYQSVSNSYNFGSDTAEGVTNGQSLGYYSHDTGALFAEVLPGSGSPAALYDQWQVGTLDIVSGLGTGTLYVSNATNTLAVAEKHSFVKGEVTVILYPGVYLLEVYQGSTVYDSGTVTVGPGQTLLLQTPLNDIQTTMSYSIHGGTPGFAPPILTYFHGGMLLQVALTTTPTIYHMDPGTSWSTSGNITSLNERWVTTQPTSGFASSFQTIEFSYYHQYLVAFTFAIQGGGSPSAPSLAGTQYGVSIKQGIVVQGQATWLDAGSTWSVTNPLQGSTTEERWQSNYATSGAVSGATTVSVTYYHQYELAVSYSITGGGNPAAPLVSGVQFGQPFSMNLGVGPAIFPDSGSRWAVQPIIASESQPGERWATSQPVSGLVSGGVKAALVYHHQFYLSAASGPAAGGTVSNPTGWFDSGTDVQLSAAAAAGWKFEGWSGLGNGSYSGPLDSAAIRANGPIVENATFYPGLTITADANGGVAYGYGSQSGSVPAGTSLTVYAPQGSTISLQANPYSILFKFGGWAPASAGSSGHYSLSLDSPSAVRASFSISPIALIGGGGVLIAIVLVSIFALKRRSKSSKPKPKSGTPAWLEPLRKSQSPTP